VKSKLPKTTLSKEKPVEEIKLNVKDSSDEENNVKINGKGINEATSNSHASSDTEEIESASQSPRVDKIQAEVMSEI